MSNIRNIYIYLTTAISLNAVTWALIAMLRSLTASGSIRSDREFLAFQIAIIIIGLPIFLIHWLWAQRLAAVDEEEQRAPLRRIYLYFILAVMLTPILANTFELFAYRLDELLSGALIHYTVTVIPLGMLFYYHQLVLIADTHETPPVGTNARIRRLYHFGFSAAGLWMVTQAVINLLHWFLLGSTSTSVISRRFLGGITPEITRLVMGLAIWLFFWRWLQTAFFGPRADEKQSIIRKVYLYLVVFISSLSAVGAATAILDGYFRQLLGVSELGSGAGPELGYAVIIGMGVVWAYHAYVLRGDAAADPDAQRSASVRRAYLYLVAGVGLATFLSGLIGDIMILIDNLTASGSLGSGDKRQLAVATAALIAGLPVWILPWRTAQLEALEEDDALAASNRRAVARKIYLYFYQFVAVMSVLGGLIYIVFQILLLVLGVRNSVGLLNELAQALAFTLIGAAVLGYHGQVLRADGRLDKGEKTERLQDFNLVLLDNHDGSFGLALKLALAAKFPHLNLTSIGLTKPAAEALDMSIKQKDIPKTLAAADLIVGPWDISVDDDSSASAITKAVVASPTVKLLAPRRKEGWDWAGIDPWNDEDLVEQTVQSVTQFLEGDEVKLARGLGLGAIAVLVIAGLCLLSFIFSLVGNLLF